MQVKMTAHYYYIALIKKWDNLWLKMRKNVTDKIEKPSAKMSKERNWSLPSHKLQYPSQKGQAMNIVI